MTATTARYDTLDAMRGLAALAVMLDHFTQHSGGPRLFASSFISVDLFFCLSGFVIAHAYQQRITDGLSLWGFLRLRVLRLYPAWLMGCALGWIALVGLVATGQTTMTPEQAVAASILNLLNLPYLGTHVTQIFTARIPADIFPLNDPGWSLFFEYCVNLLFFVLITRWSRWPFWLWPALAALIFFIAVKLFGEGPGWGASNFLGGFPRVCYGFLTGALLHHWRDRLPAGPRLPVWTLLLVLTLVLNVPAFRLHTYYSFFMTLFFVPLAVLLGARAVLPAGSRRQHWARLAGTLSYPLYCVHFPILFLIFLALPQATFWQLMVGATGAVLTAALMVQWEKPLARWLGRQLPA